MLKRFRITLTIAALCLSAVATLQSQTPAAGAAPKESPVSHHAKGTFDVKLAPQADDRAGDQSLGRFTIDKQLHGDLEGTSVGQMLSGGNPATGSGGYVAMEKVTGTLQGRSGSFILQHSGTMDKGAFQLSVTVVPGSGTGDLKGITGKLDIKITEGKHFYEFDYTLPEAK